MFFAFGKSFCGLILTGVLGIAASAQGALGGQIGMPPSQPPVIDPKADTIIKAIEPCTLTQAKLPLIAGVQMGATYDEVLAVYPEIAKDVRFQKYLEEDGSGLTNVRAANLFDGSSNGNPIKVGLFFRDRILSVISNGSGPKKYKPIQESIAEYSRPLGVNIDQWSIFYDAAAELKCVDFSFYVNADARSKGNSMSVHSKLKEVPTDGQLPLQNRTR